VTEVFGRDGTWTFEGDLVRIVPGGDKGVHKLRKALGELAVPLEALAGVAYEAGRKGAWLRLRLRDGADPFTRAVAGLLPDAADPYRLAVERDRAAVAEFFADELREALLAARVPSGPCDRYLLPGPAVPLTTTAGDGTVTFDGERIRLDWNWMASDKKTELGPQQFDLHELTGVDWNRQAGMAYGYLRFRRKGETIQKPEDDPSCIAWGIQREGGLTALVAAAVVARLPHPSSPEAAAPPETEDVPEEDRDPDAVLRRLRELGELHRAGVLDDDEFSAAKQALLRRL
jgi:hypothetical protein